MIKQKLLILIMISFFAIFSNGQEKEVQIGSYTGIGNYNFQTGSKDSLYSGKIYFQGGEQKEGSNGSSTTMSLQGSFKNGLPTGEWIFHFLTLTPEKSGKMEGLQYAQKTNGSQESIVIDFNNGIPDGKITLELSNITKSKKENPYVELNAGVVEGSLEGVVQYTGPQGIVVGRTINGGLLHDEWTFFENKEEPKNHNWVFQKGKLSKVSLNDEKIWIGSSDNQIPYKKVELSTQALSYLMAISPSQKEFLSVFYQLEDFQKKLDQLFEWLNLDLTAPKAFLTIPDIKLSKQEVNSISKNAKLIQACSQKITALKTNFNQMGKVLDRLSELAQKNEKTIIQYQYLYDNNLFSNFSSEELGQLLYDNKIEPERLLIHDHFEEIIQEKMKALEGFEQLLETSVSEAERKLNQEELIRNIKSLQIQLTEPSGQQTDLVIIHNEARIKLKQWLDNALQKVVSELPKEEFSIIEKEVNLIQTITRVLLSIPENKEQIEATYKDNIWNPFTATLMEDIVKKRIVRTYFQIVIPDFIVAIEQLENITETGKYAQQIESLTEKIILLRNQDTHRLERKLRRNLNAQKAMALILEYTPKKEGDAYH